MVIKEKRHRFPREFYKGAVTASFTLCIKESTGSLNDPIIVEAFTDILGRCIDVEECIIPVFCFMDDHQHLIISGKKSNSDIYSVIVKYKQKTGYWLSKSTPEIKWQKDFFDHIIRERREIVAQIRYVLDNPVRKGLVSVWHDYPFTGSIGCELVDVLNGVIL